MRVACCVLCGWWEAGKPYRLFTDLAGHKAEKLFFGRFGWVWMGSAFVGLRRDKSANGGGLDAGEGRSWVCRLEIGDTAPRVGTLRAGWKSAVRSGGICRVRFSSTKFELLELAQALMRVINLAGFFLRESLASCAP